MCLRVKIYSGMRYSLDESKNEPKQVRAHDACMLDILGSLWGGIVSTPFQHYLQ